VSGGRSAVWSGAFQAAGETKSCGKRPPTAQGR
jgi:hypothetical protein